MRGSTHTQIPLLICYMENMCIARFHKGKGGEIVKEEKGEKEAVSCYVHVHVYMYSIHVYIRCTVIHTIVYIHSHSVTVLGLISTIHVQQNVSH